MRLSPVLVVLASAYTVTANPLPYVAVGHFVAVGHNAGSPAASDGSCTLIYEHYTLTTACPAFSDIAALGLSQSITITSSNAVEQLQELAKKTAATAIPMASLYAQYSLTPLAPGPPAAAITPPPAAAPAAAVAAPAAAAPAVNTCTTTTIHGPHTYTDLCANGSQYKAAAAAPTAANAVAAAAADVAPAPTAAPPAAAAPAVDTCTTTTIHGAHTITNLCADGSKGTGAAKAVAAKPTANANVAAAAAPAATGAPAAAAADTCTTTTIHGVHTITNLCADGSKGTGVAKAVAAKPTANANVAAAAAPAVTAAPPAAAAPAVDACTTTTIHGAHTITNLCADGSKGTGVAKAVAAKPTANANVAAAAAPAVTAAPPAAAAAAAPANTCTHTSIHGPHTYTNVC